MGDLAALQLREPPWKPTPESELVAQYQYHDVPLVGVIDQGGREYLFMCIDGHDETLSLWWFTAIAPEQRRQIESASPDEYEDLLREIRFDGWSRLAFATTGVGIVDFEDVEDVPTGPKTAFEALVARVDALGENAHRLDVEYA